MKIILDPCKKLIASPHEITKRLGSIPLTAIADPNKSFFENISTAFESAKWSHFNSAKINPEGTMLEGAHQYTPLAQLSTAKDIMYIYGNRLVGIKEVATGNVKICNLS